MRPPHAPGRVLDRAFYARDTESVARALIGKLMVSRICPGPPRVARIVEVEAYLGERDAASHARRGRTPRTAIMFGPPGHLYVYLVYGLHHCANVVTETDGVAGAVLLRAAAPVAGFAAPIASDGVAAARVMAGPGKLCAALGITRTHDGLDLVERKARGLLALCDDSLGDDEIGDAPPVRIARSARIGVDYAGAWALRKLRFYQAGHPSVSVRPRD